MSSPLPAAYSSAVTSLLGPAVADTLTPGASPAFRAALPSLSTCELAAERALRDALENCGAELPPREEYALGGDHAARALYALTGGSPMAPSEGLRRATLEEPPGEGDGVWYGPSADGKHFEHVDAIITQASYGKGMDTPAPAVGGYRVEMQGLAGGQGGHGNNVAEVHRTLVWSGGRWVCSATLRPVWAVICLAGVATKWGLGGD